MSAVDQDDWKTPDRRRRPALPEHVMGARHLAPLQKTLDQLYEKSVHGNTRLFGDHVLVLHLLSFFNSAVRSLTSASSVESRMMEDPSETPTAVKLLGDIGRIPKSTLSDAHTRLDPKSLLPVLRQLMASLPKGVDHGADLAGIQQQILACDARTFRSSMTFAGRFPAERAMASPARMSDFSCRSTSRRGVPFGSDGVGVELGGKILGGKNKSDSKLAARNIVAHAIHLYDDSTELAEVRGSSVSTCSLRSSPPRPTSCFGSRHRPISLSSGNAS